MLAQQDLQKQLQSLVRQVRAETDRENDRRRDALRDAEQQGTARAEEAYEQLLKLGLADSDLQPPAKDFQREIAASAQPSGTAVADLDLERVTLPTVATESVEVAPAVFSSIVSSPLTNSGARADAPASDWYYSNVEHNPWAWAQGSGSGLFGTGVGETTISVDFWYSFVPQTYRFYGINPYTTYRGFYTVKSDDHWYDSHFARATLTNHVNVYQYTWKGWNDIELMNVQGDNINADSQRFDTTRNHYYSALLAAGDRAWILNRVKLNVYARGGSAFSKLDFGTGVGNYVVAPYVYVS
jgi:hypothetical protein